MAKKKIWKCNYCNVKPFTKHYMFKQHYLSKHKEGE